MILFEIAMTILAIGLIIAISLKFFWLVALVLLYRTISSIAPFDFFADKFGLDNHLVYFIVVMAISFGIYYGIILLTSQWVILRYIFYAILLVWVLYRFELAEIFLLKDWFESIGIDFSWDWLKEQFKTLFTMSPTDYLEKITAFFNGIAEGIEKIFTKLFG